MSAARQPPGASRHVIVIGGGIAGLAAAYGLSAVSGLRRSGGEATTRVTLLEADKRLGGKIRTESFQGRPVDLGAEAVLARVPEAVTLMRELAAPGELVSPSTDQAYIWARGRLRPLPPRMLAGLPGGPGPLVASGILSAPGLARAGLDLLIPSRPLRGDTSIGALVRRRLGREVHERLVDPLLGGIHAGRCDELSVQATAPQLAAAMGSGRGLVRGLRSLAASAAPGAPAAPGPVFVGMSGGLEQLIGHLADRLGDGVHVRLSTAVASVGRGGDGRLRVECSSAGADPDGAATEALPADEVLLGVPAFAAAELLERACPEAASGLRTIEYASVATILLAYAPSAIREPLRGSGFLVSPAERRLLTACTFSSAKWPQLSGEPVLLKASVGRFGEDRALALDDARLVDGVCRDLADAIGVRGDPLAVRVARFERALPQYRVGHLELVARLQATLDTAVPGVRLLGAAYRGVGVASCIRESLKLAAEAAGDRPTPAPRTPAHAI